MASERRFDAVDGTTDVYDLTVVVDRVLPVEHILEAVATATVRPAFQEEVTQRLANALRADVTTVGRHSSIRTRCESTPKKEESA